MWGLLGLLQCLEKDGDPEVRLVAELYYLTFYGYVHGIFDETNRSEAQPSTARAKAKRGYSKISYDDNAIPGRRGFREVTSF